MPIDIKDKTQCYGCSACYAVCPVDAIEMKQDERGFFYPVVETTRCVKCDLCRDVCPFLNGNEHHHPLAIYAAKNRNNDIRISSSSGGVFSEIACYIEKENGVIYGAAFSEIYEVVHKRATGNAWVDFKGSKYVQSNICNTMRSTGEDLQTGRKVLFTGTPCQVDGLKHYLTLRQIDMENLITIDIVCHGTPSPVIWKEWLSYITKGERIDSILFRDKQFGGWHGSTLTVKDDKGSILAKDTQSNGLFFQLFFNGLILKPSCGSCKYANCKRAGDFTLGDFWGIETVHPEMDDNRGTSLVMINSPKAMKLWQNIEKNIISIEVEERNCLQPNLKSPSSINAWTDDFWEEFDRKGLVPAAKTFGFLDRVGLEKITHQIKWLIKCLRRKIKNMLSQDAKNECQK